MSAQRSMTGFGRAERGVNGKRCVAYVRGVNSRFLDLKLRIPSELEVFEQAIAEHIRGRLKRGRVDLKLEFNSDDVSVATPQINMESAKAYASAFRQLKEELNMEDDVNLALIAGMPGVVSLLKDKIEEDAAASLVGLVSEAIDDFVEMSLSEAEKLCADISERINHIKEMIVKVKDGAPEDIEQQREKIKSRIMDLTSLPEINDQKLAEELAYWAARADVTEEVVRLDAHISKFREYMNGKDPAGKKLDFLIQEMFREVNTTGSKSLSPYINHLAVEMKAELEKIREQVQNLE